MKRSTASKWIVLILLVLSLSLSGLFLTSQQWFRNSHFFLPIQEMTSKIEETLSKPRLYLSNLVSDIDSLLQTFDENKVLKEQVLMLKDLESQNATLNTENKSLRESLKLSMTYADLEQIAADVLHRSPAAWNQLLTISKGRIDGVREKNLVVANGALIGFVSDIGEESATVQLLIDVTTKSNLAVKIGPSTPSYGILSAYDYDKNLFLISQLNDADNIKIGDRVVTSDLSADYAANVLIGRVVEIKQNKNSLETQVYVEPIADFSNIYTVIVLGS